MEPVVSKQFLKTALEKHFSRDIQILSCLSNNVTSSGENFASEVKRITITFSFKNEREVQTLSIIAKYVPENEYLIDFINETGFFDNEIGIYENVLPKIGQLDYKEKLAPRFYYSTIKRTPSVLIEDLSALNYKVMPRQKGLDMMHCLLVLDKLAYFHAASYALHEQDPSIFIKYNQVMFGRGGQVLELINACYGELIKTCKNYPILYQYEDKLKSSKDKIMSMVSNVNSIKSNFKVLNHGDCWINNIMFYYTSGGRVMDVAFVDFQSPCFGSNCLDLHHFLASSPQLDVKEKHKDLLDHYFEGLLKYLRKLHIEDEPTREDFDEDIRAMAFYGKYFRELFQ
ncbi:hypothetical protein RI129_009535 [Pyrocoelia pectoralis]|uniref:CHK kinase-like domain-containing protein n=1 Tax=Pyrocoelia pectoralis TaxID=417401 RepID=A0AAN7ZJ19_9COLE